MRLICPNCGAQYEVPDGVVPEQGRDVQCSSCGHTWFQAHPDHDPELADELGMELPKAAEAPSAASEQEQLRAAFAEPEIDPEEDSELDHDFEPAQDDSAEPEVHSSDEEAQHARIARRELDPAVAELLREEAEFEARQRAAEAEVGLQTQTEFGLEDPVPDESSRRAEEARVRMASRQGLPAEPEDEDERLSEEELAAHVGSRRELLPDIEEINSSLNAEGRKSGQSDSYSADGVDSSGIAKPKSGFRSGFFLGVLVIAILWSVHVYSGRIAQQVPQLAGPLQSYSATIEQGRVWLHAHVKDVLIKLDELAAASEE